MDNKPCIFKDVCLLAGPGCQLKDLIDYCSPLFIKFLPSKDILRKLKEAGVSSEKTQKIIFRIL
ncbi:hypothetical protein JW698_00075 [Candidatus Wolfebacteria bacterium]|nr:hypothetical protein [Candidatus Wolfebacteria bacterium]